MGRDWWSSRWTVEECKDLSITRLARAGVFGSGSGVYWTSRWTTLGGQESSIGYSVWRRSSGDLYLRLGYTNTDGLTGEKTDMDYTIDLATTPCNFGGVRYWFICPLAKNWKPCGRRVGKLYLPPGGKYFGCRLCYNLTYRCQKEHDKRLDAILRNPELLRRRLESGDPKAATTSLKLMLKVLGQMHR